MDLTRKSKENGGKIEKRKRSKKTREAERGVGSKNKNKGGVERKGVEGWRSKGVSLRYFRAIIPAILPRLSTFLFLLSLSFLPSRFFAPAFCLSCFFIFFTFFAAILRDFSLLASLR